MSILPMKNNYLLVFPLNTRFQARLNAYGIFTPWSPCFYPAKAKKVLSTFPPKPP
jgi:hypothetical protein